MTRLALALALALGLGLALTSSALAGPAKVLVLPLDGDADPDVRAKYSAAVQRLARSIDGKVTAGDVTFTDTATAIGCDPKAPKCAEDVRATLAVDELIYGTVSKENGKLVVVVHRVAKGQPRRDATATLEPTDAPDRAEPELQPLFRGDTTDGSAGGGGTDTGASAGAGSGDGNGGGPEGPPETPGEPPPAGSPLLHNKVLGYAAVGGGATLLIISFALWSSASGFEDDIDSHPASTYNDLVSLKDLEDRASARAWTGNTLFVLGLAAGGLGGWILYRERQGQRTVVTPAPVPGGAALMLGGAF